MKHQLTGGGASMPLSAAQSAPVGRSVDRTIMWFRRDLRLADNPALLAAAAEGAVIPLFVFDPAFGQAVRFTPRWHYLLRTVHTLQSALAQRGAQLIIRTGKPAEVLPDLVARTSAVSVHISADFSPYGAARDRAVEQALNDVPLVRTGSPYAVTPGRLLTKSGTPYRVFTPFYRAWRSHGWRAPARVPADATWAGQELPTEPVPHVPDGDIALPPAGEGAALDTWQGFLHGPLARYSSDRDRPDLNGTSHLSPHLKLGTIHPRTMLADLGGADDAFARQLAWRDFYAAILHFYPDSAHRSFQPVMQHLPWRTGQEADRLFEAWAHGRTGFPFVDAGIRQLRHTGWMHNRLRMVTASFLVKDLHIGWTRGARFFLTHLIDGDLANNQHGWQWVAGTGTDAAPFFRIFNPVTQGKRFDPDGDFIARWLPELAGLPPQFRHEPWRAPTGVPHGYHERIVDHAVERAVALADYAGVGDIERAGRANQSTLGGYLT